MCTERFRDFVAVAVLTLACSSGVAEKASAQNPGDSANRWVNPLPKGSQTIPNGEGQLVDCQPPMGQKRTHDFEKVCRDFLAHKTFFRVAVPIDPSSWITAGDYPADAAKAGEGGRAMVRLQIAEDGSVSVCEILASSGHNDLDAAICSLMSTRARFKPALDDLGHSRKSTYTRAAGWDLK